MKSETIKYSAAGKQFSGALVWDETVSARRPALLMAPNWMGVTDKAIERAKLLAGDRYVVFVADMYGDGVRPNGFEQAAGLANPLRADAMEARRRITAALDTLLKEGEKRGIVDARRKAAAGFCFGGGNVLELARAGADVAAVVSIHGDLTSPMPAAPGAIKSAVLAIHGAADPVAPKAQRDAFEAEMEAAAKCWQLLLFGSGLLHAYTDIGADVPGIAAYHEPCTRQTYAHMHDFIADAFAGKL